MSLLYPSSDSFTHFIIAVFSPSPQQSRAEESLICHEDLLRNSLLHDSSPLRSIHDSKLQVQNLLLAKFIALKVGFLEGWFLEDIKSRSALAKSIALKKISNKLDDGSVSHPSPSLSLSHSVRHLPVKATVDEDTRPRRALRLERIGEASKL
nr:hypothetical protein Iba_chr07cCG13770 [Ipomoea batatas]